MTEAIAAAVAVAVPLLLGGPAYAVDKAADGLIDITVKRGSSSPE
ncbi:hypothetical protein ACIBEJ_49540 [Nonomuraea sp. NPDC050790]